MQYWRDTDVRVARHVEGGHDSGVKVFNETMGRCTLPPTTDAAPGLQSVPLVVVTKESCCLLCEQSDPQGVASFAFTRSADPFGDLDNGKYPCHCMYPPDPPGATFITVCTQVNPEKEEEERKKKEGRKNEKKKKGKKKGNRRRED